MSRKTDNETDIHIWCKRETKRLQALYTISIGARLICKDLTRDDALEYLGGILDELNLED